MDSVAAEAPLSLAQRAGLDPARLPRHVAVIMDGNGRWARARGLPRVAGHRAGVEAVRQAVRTCGELGVEVLTLFAFSTENWSRPAGEVSELMRLLAWALSREVPALDENNVRFRVSGRTEELPEPVRRALADAEARLAGNTGLVLNLAVNYGSRREIVDAVNRLLEKGVRSVDEASFARELYTAGLPDPDLVIRTSGEMRVSNFLLWQLAYAELCVTPVFWPDFMQEELLEVLRTYQRRERRFGGAAS